MSFRPRVSSLLLLFGISLCSVTVLIWMGSRLIRSERDLTARQHHQLLDDAANRIAANLRETLAAERLRLLAWTAAPPEDYAIPEGAGLTLIDRSPEPPSDTFVEAEDLEFRQERLDDAGRRYVLLANHQMVPLRAAALLRLGRVRVKSGKRADALDTYHRLAALGPVMVSGAPAELVGRHARMQILSDRVEAARLHRDLERGRWALPRGQFEFYWSECALVLGDAGPIPSPAPLVEAAANAAASPAMHTVPIGDRHFVVLRRSIGSREAILIAPIDYFLTRAVRNERYLCEIADDDGHILAGKRAAESLGAVQAVGDTQVSWTISVTHPTAAVPTHAARERFLIYGLGAMILFLLLATIFAARTIRREAAVARLQSDFVSAVSHEFRSPLTSMRHMSEMLVLGRVPEQASREQYYASLLGETRRLQRLVESLLNFGRLEAGVKPYRFTELDPVELVRQVSAEFEALAAKEGKRIEVAAAPAEHKIQADAEALSLAVRNLIDNALKYSPGKPVIWVGCSSRNGTLAIEVRDEGLGISAQERRSIFEKFVRGSAAERTNASGTGVGLAMVAHIAQAHGGKIEVESEPEHGSKFTLLLPQAGNA